MGKRMVARFTGECRDCGGTLSKGSTIVYHGKGKGISCGYGCSAGMTQIEAQEEAKAMIAEGKERLAEETAPVPQPDPMQEAIRNRVDGFTLDEVEMRLRQIAAQPGTMDYMVEYMRERYEVGLLEARKAMLEALT